MHNNLCLDLQHCIIIIRNIVYELQAVKMVKANENASPTNAYSQILSTIDNFTMLKIHNL